MSLDALFTLFSGLPRGGPGSNASTREAISRLPSLPAAPRILDIGCGPGKQTQVLARMLQAKVTAIDIHRPFLDQLTADAEAAGLSGLVETRELSMDALDYPAASVDLIWSEGAVFILGVAEAVRLWRPLLKSGGLLAFTEATWLTDTPPAEAAAYWRDNYPAMATAAANIATIESAGFHVLDHFTLPATDWWEELYTPLEARMADLKEDPASGSELLEAIELSELEIDLYRRHGDSFGYVFYLGQRS